MLIYDLTLDAVGYRPSRFSSKLTNYSEIIFKLSKVVILFVSITVVGLGWDTHRFIIDEIMESKSSKLKSSLSFQALSILFRISIILYFGLELARAACMLVAILFMVMISHRELMDYALKCCRRRPRGFNRIYRMLQCSYTRVQYIGRETTALVIMVGFIVQITFNYVSVTMYNVLPQIVYWIIPNVSLWMIVIMSTILTTSMKMYKLMKNEVWSFKRKFLSSNLGDRIMRRQIRSTPIFSLQVGVGDTIFTYVKERFVPSYFNQVQDKTILFVVSFPNISHRF